MASDAVKKILSAESAFNRSISDTHKTADEIINIQESLFRKESLRLHMKWIRFVQIIWKKLMFIQDSLTLIVIKKLRKSACLQKKIWTMQ